MTAPQGWQPIESAPKDGTDIILWLPWIGRVRTGRWTMHKRWSADFGVAYRLPLLGEPTHWMPLPAPPVAQAAQGES